MKSKKSIEDPKALIDNGWYYEGVCVCSGTLKYKYRHPEKPALMVEWWVKLYSFRVMNGNMVKISPTPVKKMNDILKTL